MLKTLKIAVAGAAFAALMPQQLSAQPLAAPSQQAQFCQRQGMDMVNGRCVPNANTEAVQRSLQQPQQGNNNQGGGRFGGQQNQGQVQQNQGQVQQNQGQPGNNQNAQGGGRFGGQQNQGQVQQNQGQAGNNNQNAQGGGRFGQQNQGQVQQNQGQAGNNNQGGNRGGGRFGGQQNQGQVQQNQGQAGNNNQVVGQPNPPQPGANTPNTQGARRFGIQPNQGQAGNNNNQQGGQQNQGRVGNNNNNNQRGGQFGGQPNQGQFGNNNSGNNYRRFDGRRDNDRFDIERRAFGRDFERRDFTTRFYGRYGGDPFNFDRDRELFRARQNWREQYPHDYVYADDSFYSECRSDRAIGDALLGMIFGGFLGNAASGGRADATVAGMVFGGFAAANLSRDLECEDRYYVYRAYFDAFERRRPFTEYSWRNPRNGRYGTLYVGDYYRDRDGYLCATYEQEIFVRGRRLYNEGYACRQFDGTWAVLA